MFHRMRWPDAAGAYVDQLAAIGARSSISRIGCYYHNAPMESFFYTLKAEFVHQRQGASHEEARRDLFGYIEEYYNRHRIHSALGYLSREQAELKPVHQSRRKSILLW
jgi:putative transposase